MPPPIAKRRLAFASGGPDGIDADAQNGCAQCAPKSVRRETSDLVSTSKSGSLKNQRSPHIRARDEANLQRRVRAERAVRVTGQTVGAGCDDRVVAGIATRRWTEAGITWFAISGIVPELEGPVGRLLMGYQRHGDEWRREYPADTPGLEICWRNFSNCAERMVCQAARLGPVPWRETLRELCRRASDLQSEWWLTGSAALAVRGVSIEPGDVDLVCSDRGAVALGTVFADALIEPVVRIGTGWISDYWGRAFLEARLEWIGSPKPGVDSPLPSDFGPAAAARLETVTWEGWQLRVPPLDLQRAVSQRRGLTERVTLIDAIGGGGGGS